MPADNLHGCAAAPGAVRNFRGGKEPKRPNLAMSPSINYLRCRHEQGDAVDLMNMTSSHNLTVCLFSLSPTGPTIFCANESQC